MSIARYGLIAPAPGVEPVANDEQLAYASLAGPTSRNFANPVRGYRPAPRESALAMNPNAISGGQVAARESALEEFETNAELAGDDDVATPAESDWDDAFAEFGIAVGLAV